MQKRESIYGNFCPFLGLFFKFNKTNQILMGSCKNIRSWPSYGKRWHKFFLPFLANWTEIFKGTQDTIVHYLSINGKFKL